MPRAKKGQPKKKPGPKPKMGDAQRREVLETLSDGGSLRDAADLIGVNYSTVFRERKNNHEFAKGVRQAAKQGKMKHLRKIADADSWQASAWFLERKYGKEYGRKDKVDMTSKGKGVAFTLNIGNPSGGSDPTSL